MGIENVVRDNMSFRYCYHSFKYILLQHFKENCFKITDNHEVDDVK